jgi:diguanylate cyclase (GGDEF)-like protein
MHSLFNYLASQHSEVFEPVRCNEQTLEQLIRFFEDLVAEQNLSAMVIEGRFFDWDRQREAERLLRLCASARHLYLFPYESCPISQDWQSAHADRLTITSAVEDGSIESGPFILVFDKKFCGLLVSHALPQDNTLHAKTYEMIWTFDANVVYTAVEYLMGRIITNNPQERSRFETLINASAPSTISTKITFAFLSKLAMFMQRQNELELAINRISYNISHTLEIEHLLQEVVEEVGRALKAKRTILSLWEEDKIRDESQGMREESRHLMFQTASDSFTPSQQTYTFFQPTRKYKTGMLNTGALPQPRSEETRLTPPPIQVQVAHYDIEIGTLTVEDDTPGRVWEREELLMAKTVSEQIAVAVSHARLFRQVQTQAITDFLTGLYNHRFFQESLDREIKIAARNHDVVSLIILDLDGLKHINDAYGHRAGDAVLVHVANILKRAVREIDICARYGGEEFVLVLPRCGREDALRVAERVREIIATKSLPKIGNITASFGVATFPTSAMTKEDLIEYADQAMYVAKIAGRNQVRSELNNQELEVQHSR